MATADLDARQIGRDERARDPQVLLGAQEVLGVVQAKRQPDDGRDRPEGDVALAPGETDAEDLLAAEPAATHDTRAPGRRGVAPGLGTRQGEARDLLAGREARQVVPLLLLRPVAHEELRGSEGVGHHDRDGRGHAPARDLGDDGGVGERRHAEAAVLHRNDHPEEAMPLDEVPHLRREVALLLDPPVVEERAELLDRAIEERSLRRRERGRLRLEEPLPARVAGEELPFPADRSGFERRSLRVAHARQGAPHGLEEPSRDDASTDPADAQDDDQRDEGEERQSEAHETEGSHMTALGARALHASRRREVEPSSGVAETNRARGILAPAPGATEVDTPPGTLDEDPPLG